MFDIDVKDIKIIAHKNDSELAYSCDNRPYDGFVMSTGGECVVRDPEGSRHAFQKGDVIFVKRGDNYSITSYGSCSYITSAFIVKCQKDVPFICHLSEKKQNEAKKICEIWQSQRWDRYAACRIKIMQFYLEIIREFEDKNRFCKEVSAAVDFIHKNFKRNFSGDEIAGHCMVSLSRLRAKFVRDTGQTIVEYRNALRLAAACEMLESSYFTVGEIATGLGFCDVYHFSKFFKENIGCAPTKYAAK